MSEKPSRKKRPRPAPIGEVLQKVLSAQGKGGRLQRIVEAWERAVGVPLYQNARPAALKGTLLLVYVVDSSWLQQLQFLKDELIRNINQILGETMVTEVVFKIGPAGPGG